jgi:hypothetical protein
MKASRFIICCVVGMALFYPFRVIEASNISLPGSVSGVVKDANSNMPLENVLVELYCNGEVGECNFINKIYLTNQAGNWFISNLTGNYILTASKNGCQLSAFIKKDNTTGEIIERKEALEYPQHTDLIRIGYAVM